MREFSGSAIEVSQPVKAVLATLNWTAALVLLAAVTCANLPLVFAAWSLICALWGATFVGWALIVRERGRVELLADLMADVQQAPVSSLRGR